MPLFDFKHPTLWLPLSFHSSNNQVCVVRITNSLIQILTKLVINDPLPHLPEHTHSLNSSCSIILPLVIYLLFKVSPGKNSVLHRFCTWMKELNVAEENYTIVKNGLTWKFMTLNVSVLNVVITLSVHPYHHRKSVCISFLLKLPNPPSPASVSDIDLDFYFTG